MGLQISFQVSCVKCCACCCTSWSFSAGVLHLRCCAALLAPLLRGDWDFPPCGACCRSRCTAQGMLLRQALPVAFVGDSGQDDRPTRTSRSTTMHSTGDQIRVRRVPHAVSGADAAAPRDREEECVAAGGDLVTHPPGSRAVPGSIPGCPVWQWRIRAVCRRSCCYAPFTGRPDRRRYEGAAPGARACGGRHARHAIPEPRTFKQATNFRTNA